MIATGTPRQFLMVRRLISRPDQLTFYLCWPAELGKDCSDEKA
jgi:hypothetical protein